jgi:hypothetical protein
MLISSEKLLNKLPTLVFIWATVSVVPWPLESALRLRILPSIHPYLGVHGAAGQLPEIGNMQVLEACTLVFSGEKNHTFHWLIMGGVEPEPCGRSTSVSAGTPRHGHRPATGTGPAVRHLELTKLMLSFPDCFLQAFMSKHSPRSF